MITRGVRRPGGVTPRGVQGLLRGTVTTTALHFTYVSMKSVHLHLFPLMTLVLPHYTILYYLNIFTLKYVREQ